MFHYYNLRNDTAKYPSTLATSETSKNVQYTRGHKILKVTNGKTWNSIKWSIIQGDQF